MFERQRATGGRGAGWCASCIVRTASGMGWMRLAALAITLGTSGTAAIAQPAYAPAAAAEDGLLIVAVADRPEARALPGATPRAGYRGQPGYAGSDRARALADAVAAQHGLAEVSAWTIAALDLRCMLYRLPAGGDRAALLQRLQADPRVRLAQPLQAFETLAAPTLAPPLATQPTSPVTAMATAAPYNDPYLSLQQGFAQIRAAQAQRLTRGERVRVAIVDTGIDADHPDLAGRVSARRDFVGGSQTGERHGTQVAGVIAAAANNGVGIVGVAPGVQVLSYRACWGGSSSGGARCNSFTLAQALGAALADGADVINLSLGGPADPLLERLAAAAIARGAVVVAALPASGQREGFPAAVPEVLLAASAGAAAQAPAARAVLPAKVLTAPGERILTLMPGGSYDFASGSSLAAAHVSGAVALLRALDGRLRGPQLQQLLQGSGAGPIDLCAALQRRAGGADVCRAGAGEP